MSDRTYIDDTVLEVEVPSNRLELPLWLWSDQMGFFDNALDEKTLDADRTALENQRRITLEATPFWGLDDFAHEELYPAQHPYRNAVRGSPEDVRRIDRAAVLDFHRTWITPEHATLAIVGDVSSSEAVRMVERYFGRLTAGRQRIERPAPVKLEGQVEVDIAANVPTARVSIRWPAPRYLSTEDARLDVLAHLLSGHRTCWLYWDLVDKKKVATRVWASNYSADLGSEFEVTIEVDSRVHRRE